MKNVGTGALRNFWTLLFIIHICSGSLFKEARRDRVTKIHRDRFRVRPFFTFPGGAPWSHGCENRHPPTCYFVKHELVEIIGIMPFYPHSKLLSIACSYYILYPSIKRDTRQLLPVQLSRENLFIGL